MRPDYCGWIGAGWLGKGVACGCCCCCSLLVRRIELLLILLLLLLHSLQFLQHLLGSAAAGHRLVHAWVAAVRR